VLLVVHLVIHFVIAMFMLHLRRAMPHRTGFADRDIHGDFPGFLKH
jgi:hypothetical protein